MARKRKTKSRLKTPLRLLGIFNYLKFGKLNPEAKKVILGAGSVFFGFLFVLAFFNLAGPLGRLLLALFEDLFGWGKWLVPLSFFVFGFFTLFKPDQEKNYFDTGFGLFLILVALLGSGDLLGPGWFGILGRFFGSLEKIIGFWPSLIGFLTLLIIGFVLDFGNLAKDFLAARKQRPLVKLDKIRLPVSEPIQPDGLEEKIEPKSVVQAERKITGVQRFKKPFIDSSGWQFPSLDLLETDGTKPTVGDIRVNSQIIQRTLADFGIAVEMGEINIGPTVTQYTLKPAQGIKLSRIVALQNDLALALAAHPLRIEAPIPGKSLVGIEVPNKTPSLVRLRSLVESPGFADSPAPLLFPLGRDVMGAPVLTDVSKLPHLLIAGATGAGKSIFIHSILTSLVYRNPPDSLRFILIDPKRVELSAYEDIPYLLCPVITQGKKAILALKWAITEMERRYDLLLEEKARDILSYNQKIGKNKEKALPYILIFIDELADLMSVYGKELEAIIIRLSQMARATGIHLIVSTQRPSVEVITGLIKANITARIAFQVASQVDSRTILDAAGAEKLLGRGDLLFISAETSKPKRIQASYISEKEVERVVDYLKQTGKKILGEEFGYDSDILEMLNQDLAEVRESELLGDEDELYQRAYEVVVQSRKASASLLQRRLRIGYARAARLLDMLEARGVIGQAQGAKPREVYIQDQEFTGQDNSDEFNYEAD
ncbi:MAG: DNA translocase FtsK [Patescibacteria group bacterium]